VKKADQTVKDAARAKKPSGLDATAPQRETDPADLVNSVGPIRQLPATLANQAPSARIARRRIPLIRWQVCGAAP